MWTEWHDGYLPKVGTKFDFWSQSWPHFFKFSKKSALRLNCRKRDGLIFFVCASSIELLNVNRLTSWVCPKNWHKIWFLVSKLTPFFQFFEKAVFEVELPKTWWLNFFCSFMIDSATQCEQKDIMGISQKLAQNLFFGLKVDPIFSIFRKSRLWGWIAENVMIQFFLFVHHR